ncbi:type II toxin-antitoxin system RelE/ParE family toxin [Thalassomonas sp. RHCl1]|uniref:type II toxin-antitoxin system RelE/ParE family toxin n=1 Tax=Thalassomonas sp. RHCl1 TaxID=2995320 RepID=UPI00248BEC40|nr:type II toxin-antitoxin system RelE/ParE family toxin [Thalassomonas sp. RHCl1]
MPTFKLTPDAQTDLIEIRRYTLAQWGREQSQKYLFELRQTIQVLSETPTIGKKHPDVGINIYSFSHASHVIYYMISKQQLIVFAVLHKNMLPLLHLEHRNTI